MREGWEYKKLEEVCDFQGGSQPPKMEWSKEPQAGYVRMLQIRDFTQNATDYIEYVKESKSLKYCKEDDILIGRYGASVGKILTGLSGAYNVAIIKTIPREIVNKNYIKYYFLSPYFQHNLLTVSQHRAAQAGFSKEDISDFSFPLPPLSEQQRIVSELDLLSSIIEKKKAQLKEYDQLAQSIFYDMFGDPVTNEKGWEKKNLEEVCEKITDGTHNSPVNTETGDYMYITAKNIKKDGIILDNITYVSANVHKAIFERCNPKFGDVLYIKDGVTTGVATINTLKEEFSLLSSVALLKPQNCLVNHYLKAVLNMPSQYASIRENMGGAAITRLTIAKINQIIIPLPPLPLQQSFASKIEAIERQKALIQQSIAEVQMLFDSRMDDWFA